MKTKTAALAMMQSAAVLFVYYQWLLTSWNVMSIPASLAAWSAKLEGNVTGPNMNSGRLYDFMRRAS